MRLLIAILFLICAGSPLLASSPVVVDLQLKGLKRVKKNFVMRFIESRPGQPLDTAVYEADVQRMHNLQLFEDVQHALIDSAGGVVISLTFKENFTLIPLVNFGTINENFFLELGGSDYNFQGKGNTLGLLYRWYDRHSLTAWYQVRYLGSSRWGLYTFAARNATLEPTYFGDQVVRYEVDFYNAGAYAKYELQYNHWLEFGGGYIYERYVKAPEDLHLTEYGPDLFKVQKYQMRVSNTLNRINYFYQYRTGFQNVLAVDGVLSPNPVVPPFWKVDNDFRYYRRLRKRGNLAVRGFFGFSENTPSPFAPFVIDSYVNIRGSGNRIARGTALTVINAEYRHSFFEGKWGAIQGVAFTDHGMLRPPGAPFGRMFWDANQYTYSGLGGRLYLRKIYNFTLRADVGMNVRNSREIGFVLGAGQYF